MCSIHIYLIYIAHTYFVYEQLKLNKLLRYWHAERCYMQKSIKCAARPLHQILTMGFGVFLSFFVLIIQQQVVIEYWG